jgi:hypothetical protein
MRKNHTFYECNLTKCINYILKTANSTKMPEVKSNANVMLILRIFLDQKLFKYFLKKTHFNLTWHFNF